MVTPSTPTAMDPPTLYPAGRLPQYQDYWADEDLEVDTTLKPVSRYGFGMSARTCRITVIMTVLGLVALLHFVVIRALTEEEEK